MSDDSKEEAESREAARPSSIRAGQSVGAQAVSPKGRERDMRESAEDRPWCEDLGPEREHERDVLDRGEAEGDRGGVDETSQRLVKVGGGAEAEPYHQVLAEFLDEPGDDEADEYDLAELFGPELAAHEVFDEDDRQGREHAKDKGADDERARVGALTIAADNDPEPEDPRG